MKRPSKSRVIVAGLVHGDNTADTEHLNRCAMAFVGNAWGEYDYPKDMMVTVLVEGEPRESIEQKNFRINWNTVEIAECMIAAIENPSNKRGKGNQLPDEANIFLSVGSKEFCQAWVHFWATSQKDAPTWGLHMLRKLTGMRPGDVAWYDTQDDSLTEGKIGEMYLAMQKAAGIAT